MSAFRLLHSYPERPALYYLPIPSQLNSTAKCEWEILAMHAVPVGRSKCHRNWCTSVAHSSAHLWWTTLRNRSKLWALNIEFSRGLKFSYLVLPLLSPPRIRPQIDRSTATESQSDWRVAKTIELLPESFWPISSLACTGPIYHLEKRRQSAFPSDSTMRIYIWKRNHLIKSITVGNDSGIITILTWLHSFCRAQNIRNWFRSEHTFQVCHRPGKWPLYSL